jgi:MFS family permease
LATSIIFFVLGAAGGSWLGRIPAVSHNLSLNEAVLGTILLIGAFGGLAAMQLAPHLLKAFGHRKVLGVLAPIYPLTMFAIPLAFNSWSLAAALVLTNGVGSLVGVIINTHAVDVEVAYERAIMSSFHGMYSVGALVGSGIAGLLANLHVSVLGSMGGAAVVHSLLILAVISWLLQVAHADPKVVDDSIDHLAHHSHRKSWWRGVVLIGSLTFVAYMAEGSIGDWSALFLREHLHATAGAAVTAFVAFSACMTIGRLSGDFLAEKLGKVRLVRGGALLGALGLLLGIGIPNIFVSIVGFGLVGCGLSILVPVLFSVAGGLGGGETHAAIARVSTIAYFGLLVGPAFIGWVAHTLDLQHALLIPAILLVFASFGAGLIRRVVRRPATLEA